MGNINSQTGQITAARLNSGLRSEISVTKTDPEPWSRSHLKSAVPLQHKVLPEQGSRQKLRTTGNGEILQSGGTLSGRHQNPLENADSRLYLPAQRYSFHKTGLRANQYQNRQHGANQKLFKSQVKSYKSEPDLRLSSVGEQEMKDKKSKKKYKAPPPPCRQQPIGHRSADWTENSSDEYVSRKTRLFKTRAETKKETSQFIRTEQIIEDISDVVEEKILAHEKHMGNLKPNRLSLPEFNAAESDEFQRELREATDRLRNAKTRETEQPQQEGIFGVQEVLTLSRQIQDSEERCTRGEPSGKESSTPEASPVLGVTESQKPRAFYFGMEREDSDVSSNCPIDDDDDNPAIALRLRPVLPRKPPEVPRFSPAAAWRLLDARSHDSGISDDVRAPPPLSWTPQQDLGDDSSLEEARRVTPRPTRTRPHVFSLSLPRDNQLASFAAMGPSRNGVSSLRRLKRSVSGVLNTLSNKKEPEKKTTDDPNWFFSRSAPNSLNENSSEPHEVSFPHTSSTSRLMYLPNTTPRESLIDDNYPLSVFSKSCEELRVPESLRDTKNDLDILWTSDDRAKKTKKFTFQSTVRQIERKRMAEKLSKEAEKKEKQRLKELEAMQKVEEEFQRKRAKEKANIRQQLRLYAMDDNQWTSLPPDLTIKTEERQEPDGALSSSTSSSPQPPKSQELLRKSEQAESKITLHVTRELSEYRQAQRDYKEYRGHSKYTSDCRYFKPTTIHPEVTCNMPKAKGSNFGNGNYRKDFAYGMMSSNHSEDSPNNSPQMYHNKYSPITRF